MNICRKVVADPSSSSLNRIASKDMFKTKTNHKMHSKIISNPNSSRRYLKMPDIFSPERLGPNRGTLNDSSAQNSPTNSKSQLNMSHHNVPNWRNGGGMNPKYNSVQAELILMNSANFDS